MSANINKPDYSTKSQKRRTRLTPRLRSEINPHNHNHVHFILLSLVWRLPSRHETNCHNLTHPQLEVRVTWFLVCTIFWHLLPLLPTCLWEIYSSYCHNLTQSQLEVRVTWFFVCTIFWHLLLLLPTCLWKI